MGTLLEDASLDASVCIALAHVEHLHLLGSLFGRLLLPDSVVRELLDGPGTFDKAWQVALERNVVRFESSSIRSIAPGWGLSATDREVVGLAKSHGAWALVDDAQARRAATAHDVRVMGTVGVLVASNLRGACGLIKPLLEKMRQNGFRIREDLVVKALRRTGEA